MAMSKLEGYQEAIYVLTNVKVEEGKNKKSKTMLIC